MQGLTRPGYLLDGEYRKLTLFWGEVDRYPCETWIAVGRGGWLDGGGP